MLSFLKRLIIDTLGFSKTEATGTIIMIFVIIAFAIVPKVYYSYTHDASKKFDSDTIKLKKWALELESSIESQNNSQKVQEDMNEPATLVHKSFDFDPNTVNKEELMTLGFKERTANNILKYREKGGSFRVKKDLQNIYGISQSRISELWNHISLPEEIVKPKYQARNKEERVPKASFLMGMDIDLVTAEDLQSIQGIGPVLSERIVKYRDRLGGYHTSTQLSEVYGLSDELVLVLDSLLLFESRLKTLNINTDTFKILQQHPYIEYHIARAIFNYRQQHGRIESISEIKSIKIISDSLYQKIYPYLSTDR
ncbi:MAG: helix-hairpin-helix domain-containing protein [Cyclobacteriaceae bacterium]